MAVACRGHVAILQGIYIFQYLFSQDIFARQIFNEVLKQWQGVFNGFA